MKLFEIMLGDIPCLEIKTPDMRAVISLQGAQLIELEPTQGRPWLWANATHRRLSSCTPIRAGVPICWPWFGDIRRNPASIQQQHGHIEQALFHGDGRTLLWTLTDTRTDTITFTLDLPQGLADWPYPVRATMSFSFKGSEVSMALTTNNLGATPLYISQALHTYFAVHDVRQVVLPSLDGCRYLDTKDGWHDKVFSASERIDGEVDRVFPSVPKEISIVDTDRVIQLRTEGSASAIVWNPGPIQAASISQFNVNAWTGMLCVEVANVLDDVVCIAPNEHHTLRLTVQVNDLLKD